MKIDLEVGAFLQIEGELGKYNSIPIDKLVRIAEDFQNLILTIAKYDLPATESIDLNNFKIELVDFKKGSAVPKFAFTSRSENLSGLNWKVHRNIVNEKFEKLVEISNTGEYNKLVDLYPEPIKRNPIVENLYSFANGFDNSPANFVDYSADQKTPTKIYKINRFKQAIKKDLISEIVKPADSEIGEAVGRIKVTKKGGKTHRRILTSYSSDKYSLEFAPEIIIHEGIKYLLNHPLRCRFQKEENIFIIESELLGIIGSGKTEDEAEIDFAEEFNFIYQRLNSLSPEEITRHNSIIKTFLNHIVKSVE